MPELEDYPLRAEDWADVLDRHEALLRVLRSADLDACTRALRAHIILRTGDERDETP